MMTVEEAQVVKMVYSRFIGTETEEWSEIDDALEMMSWLKPKELVEESRLKYKEHSKGIFRCTQDHSIEHCLAPYILESVDAILALYDKTHELHPKNAYILTYYLSLSELKMIYVSETSQAI